MESRMQDSHKSFLIKDLLGDVLRPGAGIPGRYISINYYPFIIINVKVCRKMWRNSVAETAYFFITDKFRDRFVKTKIQFEYLLGRNRGQTLVCYDIV